MRLLLTFPLAFVVGCASNLPPPDPPARVAPAIGVPTMPDAPNQTRVTLDTAGDTAKVSRVTETTTASPPVVWGKQYPPYSLRKTELLCVTPCIVDLAPGAHTLVFTSTTDATRTSDADVVVSNEPIVVRHALGVEKPMNGSYVGGLTAALSGGGLTLIGVAFMMAGIFGKPQTSEGKKDPNLLPAGIIFGSVGLAVGATGILFMTGNRPVHQTGATVQWAER
jgi:hypothetical protein